MSPGGVRRRYGLVALALAAGLAWAPLSAGRAGAEPTAYATYYRVAASYRGAPENLPEIAQRFLGDAGRASEVLALNVGRRQPDGSALSAGSALHAGWLLVLPWDAAGPGLTYGQLPTTAAVPARPKPSARTDAPRARPSRSTMPVPAPTSRATTPLPSATLPSATRPSATRPSATRRPSAPRRGCGIAQAGRPASDWATLWLAPERAWSRTKGAGQTVAVVDSGIDGDVAQLSGSVLAGADVVAGSARGDIDCLGSGTAMAGIIAAQPNAANRLVGIAPQAKILPIRVVTTATQARAADAATAVQLATATGATVIAIGERVDSRDPALVRAVASAVGRNILVVVPAPTATTRGGNVSPGVLRVGGVRADGKPLRPYVTGQVDVVAPGAAVATLGLGATGPVPATGTEYAVAFVAGQAALVRAAHPGLTSTQVARRIEVTASRMSDRTPDPQTGWGLIDPGRSVSVAVDGERPATEDAKRRSDGPTGGQWLLALIAAGALGTSAVLAVRARRSVVAGRRSDPSDPEVGHSGDVGGAEADLEDLAVWADPLPVGAVGAGGRAGPKKEAVSQGTVSDNRPESLP